LPAASTVLDGVFGFHLDLLANSNTVTAVAVDVAAVVFLGETRLGVVGLLRLCDVAIAAVGISLGIALGGENA
jgi:hypothetical protein